MPDSDDRRCLSGDVRKLGHLQSRLNKRRIGHWGPMPEEVSIRSWATRIPVTGWLQMKSETRQHGYRFWVRPMWIEIGMALFFGYSYSHFAGIGEHTSAPLPEGFLWQQCIPYLTMATLLCIATFVDFDERMIPDEITVSGTLLALVLAAFLPKEGY